MFLFISLIPDRQLRTAIDYTDSRQTIIGGFNTKSNSVSDEIIGTSNLSKLEIFVRMTISGSLENYSKSKLAQSLTIK